MEFPELIFGSDKAYLNTRIEIADFFLEHKRQLSDIMLAGSRIRNIYKRLEPFFDNFTGPICGKCPDPCCVNRHGFPDFEDLVLFQAMGTRPPDFNCMVNNTETCQFLSPGGCILPRHGRSYRCTWYFCDSCMDEFHNKQRAEYEKFKALMKRLSKKRILLLERFEKEWFA